MGMNFTFTHPAWLLALPPAFAWLFWLAWRSDASLTTWRKWIAFGIRVAVVLAVVLALAGIRWMRPQEGMNVVFLLDRSDSVPSEQQEAAREWVNKTAAKKKQDDQGGVLVFGAEAAIETSVAPRVAVPQIQAVVPTQRSDLAAAVRLGTAALPEHGQRRLVLFSDGNENLGDAVTALASALPLGVSLYAVPLGQARVGDVALQKLALPPTVKKGQTFETKIFVQSDRARPATLRLYRNNQFLGEQQVELSEGKNLFSFPQSLPEPGFYSYDVAVDAPGDALAQNNRAAGFTHVRGEPSALLVSSRPEQDAPLAEALRSAKLDVRVVGVNGFPPTLAELQSYDTIFLSNVGAGEAPREAWKLLEAAVRDFGVGLVCVGGDNAYLAGGYKGTPLETMLPVDMELDSKKVLPSGAIALVIDRSGSMSGDKLEMAKQAAMAAVEAMTDRDQVGVIAFDGKPYVIVEMQRATDRKKIMGSIAGIGLGGGTVMYPAMEEAFAMLKPARAAIKHCVLLTDGVSQPGDFEGLAAAMAEQKITVSTVGVGPDIDGPLLNNIAVIGRGRFYEVPVPQQIPQIFLQETALILKTAIMEEPFTPRRLAVTEPVRGLGAEELPQLLGYVATTLKPRAEQPLGTHKGDPLLAHWQFGLGRSVAFTSDARAKWAQPWLGWERYRQFWSQVAQWSLRRVGTADLQAEIAVENGDGALNVEAVDSGGNYRNFLTLDAVVVSPNGERQTVRLQQTGAGRYEAKFPMREVGSYLVNLLEFADGQLRGAQAVGASINYSPEFNTSGANLSLLQRLAELGKGRLLDPRVPEDNPFLLDRQKTFRPEELWEWLLRFAIIAFVLDVGVRRIDLGREEWAKAARAMRRWAFFWRKQPVMVKPDESLAALLARRERVRSQTPVATAEARAELFQPVQKPTVNEPQPGITPPSSEKKDETAGDTPAAPSAAPQSTASLLLEAKRRAQRK